MDYKFLEEWFKEKGDIKMAYLFTAITLWVIAIATAAYFEHLAFSKNRFYLIGYSWLFAISGAIATLIFIILWIVSLFN